MRDQRGGGGGPPVDSSRRCHTTNYLTSVVPSKRYGAIMSAVTKHYLPPAPVNFIYDLLCDKARSSDTPIETVALLQNNTRYRQPRVRSV